jgi:lipoyl(octanoyl) transferase
MMARMPGLHHRWGRAPYAEVHRLQERLVAWRAADLVPNLLLTGEHDPVVTRGRGSGAVPGAPSPVPVVLVERGGEDTYHGPGQLVAYPVVHLTQARRDLHRFQRDLEEVGIRTLADFGLEGTRREGLTGVWAQGRKLMSLGIAVRRWVTWHGLALNVVTDLEAFRDLRPCGLDGRLMGSIAALLGAAPPLGEVEARLVHHAGAVLPGGPFLPGPLPLAPTEGQSARPQSVQPAQ